MPVEPNSRLIILIEDPFICTYLRFLLAPLGFQVREASPRRGAELVQKNAGNIAVVITNTPELLTAFAEQVPLLYLSAVPDPAVAARFRSCRSLQKPFHPQQFLEAVEALTGSL